MQNVISMTKKIVQASNSGTAATNVAKKGDIEVLLWHEFPNTAQEKVVEGSTLMTTQDLPHLDCSHP